MAKKLQCADIEIDKLTNSLEMAIDFHVDPRPLTKEEEKRISDFIKADKKKHKRKKTIKIRTNA
jgi:hypothetical protein